jgi:hypothetical protein
LTLINIAGSTTSRIQLFGDTSVGEVEMMKRFIDINTIVAFLLVLVITVLVFQFQRSGPIPEIVAKRTHT